MSGTAPLILHASAVAFDGRGVLIRGGAGSGKSALALGLLSRSGRLLADDRTCLGRRGADLIAWSPEPLLGLIEARGVGLLHADPAPPAALRLVVDLDAEEPDRLPPDRSCDILGRTLPLVLGAGHPYLADVIPQFLRSGRLSTP